MEESRIAVLAALLGNLALAIVKGISAAVTGSAAMMAETFHSCADTGNQVVRKIDLSGNVTTVAGVAGRDGIVLGPLPGGLSSPTGVAMLAAKVLAVTTGSAILKIALP